MTNSLTSDERERQTAEQWLAQRGYSDSRPHSAPAIAVLLNEYARHLSLLDHQAAGSRDAEIVARQISDNVNQYPITSESVYEWQCMIADALTSAQESTATRMRDKCVEKLTETLDSLVIELPPDADSYLRGQGWNSALQRVKNEVVPVLQSLTLDNGETDARSNS